MPTTKLLADPLPTILPSFPAASVPASISLSVRGYEIAAQTLALTDLWALCTDPRRLSRQPKSAGNEPWSKNLVEFSKKASSPDSWLSALQSLCWLELDPQKKGAANLWCHFGRSPLFVRDDASRLTLHEVAAEMFAIGGIGQLSALRAIIDRLPPASGPATIGFVFRTSPAELRLEIAVDPSLGNAEKLATLGAVLRSAGGPDGVGALAALIEQNLFAGVGMVVGGPPKVSVQFAAKSGGILPWAIKHGAQLGLRPDLLASIASWQIDGAASKSHEIESRRLEAIKFEWTERGLGDAKLYFTAVSPSKRGK